MRHDLMAANAALTRKHWATDFVRTCRALGMTDDEIRAALTTAAPTQPAALGEASQPNLEQAGRGASGSQSGHPSHDQGSTGGGHSH